MGYLERKTRGYRGVGMKEVERNRWEVEGNGEEVKEVENNRVEMERKNFIVYS